ncbi:hypothetical protein A2164_01030 [Candidatus Curtissbacteria bacterium RBG_13_35_7]|uniref:Peptidase M24 domain-containing protein n=1 Tax=Candidatus Curtissbacteria bacterium RBG_13_35_7 TaxID=1797705 RepID=A0A1F5G443_9BACT|nr:MAG: hypothetical protein A2164_01030 [Candidatus Curtissbacteria bacterium RBG_13_35_7]
MVKFAIMANRQQKSSKILKDNNLNGLIITNPYNIFYLTGFIGANAHNRESILIVTPNKFILITSSLYQFESRKLKSKFLNLKIARYKNEINQHIINVFKNLIPKSKIGFEEHDLKVSEHKEYKKLLKDNKLIPTKNIIENLRSIKSQDEIKNIEKAQKISQRAFEKLIQTVKCGQTENEIADNLQKIIKSLGAGYLAFDPIVASGPNSAKPHYLTGNRRLKTNDILLVDFGAKYHSYCADLTRTIFVGHASDRFRNIYAFIQSIQQKSIAKITTNLKASTVFNYANSIIKKNKFERNFLHSLGHGVGLEIHENPHLGKNSQDTLRQNMIFSIEPGLYFPSWGGIRIEDLVVIKNTKAIILGKNSRFIETGKKE